MASIAMSVEDFTNMTERRVMAEMKIKELEAKIDALTLSLGKIKAPKKEPTPEEVEILKQKRSEAGKKAAQKRAEKLAAKKEEERLALINKLKDEIRTESEAESACSVTEDSSSEHQELV
jgi:Skp family chaperone for outer membrane proteins